VGDVTERWLSGDLESPIRRDEHDDNWHCQKCGEWYEFCECPVPRLNQVPPLVRRVKPRSRMNAAIVVDPEGTST